MSMWPGLWPSLVGGGVAVLGGAGAVGGTLISVGNDDARSRDTAIAVAISSGVIGALGLATMLVAVSSSPATTATTEVSP
jgi:hypothetical protein